MKNVYDIKKDEKLNFILPKDAHVSELSESSLKGRVLVVIHLYYPETVENYIPYIEAVPSYADVIITVSNHHIEQIIEDKNFGGKDRCRIICKQNKGRDISSFLVACRTDILRYEYICFVHDKKAKDERSKEDADKWVNSLWENSLASTFYINNIVTTFLEHPQLGVLVPPIFVGEYINTALVNSWYNNYEIMVQLAQKLKLNCNLDKEKSPITIGTVFWARVDALRKLFEYSWRYEDFDDEPLKNDGTLSHAIERSLAYVAQDANYKTGWVMTDVFAGERMQYVENILQQTFYLVRSTFGLQNIWDINSFEMKCNKIKNFCKGRDKVYIYGAGKYAKRCVLLMNYLEIKIYAILVTELSENTETFFGYSVIAIDEESIDDDSGIVVAVSQQYQLEVIQQIHQKCNGQEHLYIF